MPTTRVKETSNTTIDVVAPTRSRNLRRGGAVLAGLATIVATHTGMDALMHATGVFPPVGQPMSDSLFLLAAAYRAVFSVAGCYVTARLAPDRAMAHALVVGGLGVILSTAGAVTTWNAGPAFGPRWYALSLIAMSMPCAWVGGQLRELQRSAHPHQAL